MNLLNTLSEIVNKILLVLGGIFLVGMIVLTCANIVLRVTWLPVRGTFELMGFFGAIVTAFALSSTQQKRGHIAVDVLVNSFSPKTRQFVTMINRVTCMGFFGVATWQLAKKATILWNTGEVTETLRIIYYPFIYAVAFGCAALSLVFCIDLAKSLLGR